MVAVAKNENGDFAASFLCAAIFAFAATFFSATFFATGLDTRTGCLATFFCRVLRWASFLYAALFGAAFFATDLAFATRAFLGASFVTGVALAPTLACAVFARNESGDFTAAFLGAIMFAFAATFFSATFFAKGLGTPAGCLAAFSRRVSRQAF